MKAKNLFPLVEPNLKFKNQLELEVLDVYNQGKQPRFNWRYLIAPGVALASLLLVLLIGNGQPFSQLPGIVQPNQPGITQFDSPTQNSGQGQQNGDSQPTKLAEKPQNLDQLDQELSELSSTLDTDTDLKAAIAFNGL